MDTTQARRGVDGGDGLVVVLVISDDRVRRARERSEHHESFALFAEPDLFQRTPARRRDRVARFGEASTGRSVLPPREESVAVMDVAVRVDHVYAFLPVPGSGPSQVHEAHGPAAPVACLQREDGPAGRISVDRSLGGVLWDVRGADDYEPRASHFHDVA